MYKVSSNYDNIKQIKNKMSSKIEEVYNELLIVESKIEQTKLDFDTPLATKFRTKASDIVNKEKRIINNELFQYIERLDIVANKYEQLYNVIKEEVYGDKK